jgi:hypothetical protein
MMRSRTWLGTLAVLAGLSAPAAAQIPDAKTLLSNLGFSQGQIQQVMSGQIVGGELKAASDRELVASMAFQLPAPPSQFIADLKAGIAAKSDPTMKISGAFTGAGSPADLARLTLDAKRANAYTSAAPGEDLNLSLQEIASFNQLAGSDAASVTSAVRVALVNRLTAYRQKGLAGIAPYARENGASRSCGDEIRTMTEASKALKQYVPSAYQMLLGYPGSKAPGTEEFFGWAQIDAHGTPALTLRHSAFVPDGDAFVIVQRMFYVSASFNCEQAIAALLPVQGGSVVVYGNRTSTDQVEGWGGSAKRSIGSKLLASQLEALFEKVRKSVK